MRKSIAIATAVAALTVSVGQAAQAESKGYIVRLWVPAMNNFDDSGCPDGRNADAPKIMTYTLERKGMPKAEIEKFTAADTMTGGSFGEVAGQRGTKNGKPANAYVYPLTVPDPKIKLDVAKEAFGFNLDGKVSATDYSDPITKEAGVDNMAARVFGCFDRTRGTYEAPPGNQTFRWSHYSAGNSWLVEVTNNSDRPINWENDDSVTVKFYRGQQIPLLSAGGFLRNATYTIDPNSDLKKANTFKGKIVNGQFVSDRTPQFTMVGSSRIQPIYDFKSALMRMKFMPDGRMEGFVGGYLPIKMVYFPFGDYATAAEYIGGMDVPGVFHALLKNADTDIDAAKNGARTRISMTYLVRGEPAFIRQPDPPQKVSAR